MISRYVQEQKRYTLREISQLLNLSEEKTVVILKRLKIFNVVKAVKASDLQRQLTDLVEEDIQVADVTAGSSEYYYVFTFVGVITISGRILKCYPKYLPQGTEPVTTMKQVLKVLEKYNSREQIIHIFTETDQGKSFNLLAVMLSLLADYHEHGLYSNTQEIIESNGMGEILWDKTINETFAMLSSDRAYYFDLQTRKRIQNEYDYFHRLHACILTILSKELDQTDLPELFDIATVDLSEEMLDDFGDHQYVLDQIERELNVEFNTRKQNVLKTIYAYISRLGSITDEDCMAFFGTNSFNLVWEAVCADVLNNQLSMPLGSLKLPTPLSPKYSRKQKLIDIIERPVWEGNGYSYQAEDTLIPDVVTIECGRFLIFDAKYYVTRLEPGKPLSGQPGIESITKQYLYQLAYKQFMEEHGINEVINCFLMPTAGNTVTDKGTVSLPMMDAIGLQRIRVLSLPASMMFENYLAGGHLFSSVLFG